MSHDDRIKATFDAQLEHLRQRQRSRAADDVDPAMTPTLAIIESEPELERGENRWAAALSVAAASILLVAGVVGVIVFGRGAGEPAVDLAVAEAPQSSAVPTGDANDGTVASDPFVGTAGVERIESDNGVAAAPTGDIAPTVAAASIAVNTPVPLNAAVSPTPVRAAEALVHVVEEGDTLGHIARRYGLTIDALRRANPELDLSVLFIGQSIRLRPPITSDASQGGPTQPATPSPANAPAETALDPEATATPPTPTPTPGPQLPTPAPPTPTPGPQLPTPAPPTPPPGPQVPTPAPPTPPPGPQVPTPAPPTPTPGPLVMRFILSPPQPQSLPQVPFEVWLIEGDSFDPWQSQLSGRQLGTLAPGGEFAFPSPPGDVEIAFVAASHPFCRMWGTQRVSKTPTPGLDVYSEWQVALSTTCVDETPVLPRPNLVVQFEFVIPPGMVDEPGLPPWDQFDLFTASGLIGSLAADGSYNFGEPGVYLPLEVAVAADLVGQPDCGWTGTATITGPGSVPMNLDVVCSTE